MVLEDCHYFVFVEIWYPVEKCIKESLRIAIECLTDTINRHVVVSKLYLIPISLESIYHILFLPSIKPMHIPRIQQQVHHIRKCKMHNSPSPMHRWHLLNNLKIIIPIVMLWEIYQETWSPIIYSNIHTG